MRDRKDEIIDMLHYVTGKRWAWYWSDVRLLGVDGAWQLMPADPQDEGKFWDWYVTNRPQFFENPSEAAVGLLVGWTEYKSAG